MTGPYHDIARAIAAVRVRIAEACRVAGREGAAVMLVGVTKTHPPAVARAAVEAGLLNLGENRVEELLAKQPHVPGARWHLVGRLQRRKVRDVIGRQVLLHGVDRRSLVDELERRAEAAGILQRILIQVNVGEDPAKGGCRFDDALDLVSYARERHHLTVEGLMTIPPLPPPGVDAGAEARPYFSRLRELRDAARSRFPEVVHLSMGMSADFAVAIAEGATIVRVGSALFGPRSTAPWQADLLETAQEDPQ